MKKVFLLILTSVFFSITQAEEQASDSLTWVHLQDVEIIATRATDKTPIAYSDIRKEEIEAMNFGQDIPFLITLTPSVIATSEAGAGIGYTGFRIRGTDANRINITSNGIPINDSESHTTFWVNLPDFASSLEDIQVQRGVGTSTNGAGAFGASINMKTETIPMTPYAEFNGSYGSFNTAKATFKIGTGLIKDHWAFDARLSSITTDGFIDRASVDLKSYFLQGGYFNENTIFKFITFSGKEKTYHAWDGVPEEILFPEKSSGKKADRTYNSAGYMGDDENGNPMYYENQTDNYHQTHYQLSLLQVLNENLNLNVAAHYTKGDGYYEEYKQEASLINYGLKPFSRSEANVYVSDLIRQKHLDNDFYGGIFSLDYKKDKLELTLGGGGNYYDGNHFGKVIWVKNYANDTSFFPEHEYYRSTGKKTDMNIYLKGSYQVFDWLNVFADLQYRYIDYKIKGQNEIWDWLNEEMQQLNIHEKYNFFNPKAGLFFQINPKNSAYASIAVANREPNRNNFTEAGFNEVPKSERLTDYEIGYKYNNRTLAAGINLYYMKYKNQLVLNGKTNEIGEQLTSNVPDSYRMGVEFILGAKITKGLKWDGNLTLSQNKIKNYSEYIPVYDAATNDEYPQKIEYYGTTDISFSPDVIANSLFSFKLKDFSAGLQSSYVGRQFLNNTSEKDRSIDSYFVNNLRLGYDFQVKGLKKLSLNLLINNIFNEKYEVNGWTWKVYHQQIDGNLIASQGNGYYPQAGTNVLANLTIRF